MRNPFKKIKTIDENLLDISFNNASELVAKTLFEGFTIDIVRQKEGLRIKTVASSIFSILRTSIESFPVHEEITGIYRELAQNMAGGYQIDDTINKLNKTSRWVKNLQMKYLDKLQNCYDSGRCRIARKEFYGRVSTAIKKRRKEIEYFNTMAKTFKLFPDFEEAPTFIIAGLPNVGKSSLLSKLTGSKPDIQPYPFTTKGLMMGYVEGLKRIQLIDTPGLLDRPLKKRNEIEMHSIIALKHLAHYMIYVFDLSETSGYSLDNQLKLYEELKDTFKLKTILVANKADVEGGKSVEELGLKDVFVVSTLTGDGIDKLLGKIKSISKEIRIDLNTSTIK